MPFSHWFSNRLRIITQSIFHGWTRLFPPSVIYRHKHGWFFLTIAPTHLKVPFASRHTRLLPYRLLLIADFPGYAGQSQRKFRLVSVLFFERKRQESNLPPSFHVFRGACRPLLAPPRNLSWRLIFLNTPLEGRRLSHCGWFDFGGYSTTVLRRVRRALIDSSSRVRLEVSTCHHL